MTSPAVVVCDSVMAWPGPSPTVGAGKENHFGDFTIPLKKAGKLSAGCPVTGRRKPHSDPQTQPERKENISVYRRRLLAANEAPVCGLVGVFEGEAGGCILISGGQTS